MNHPDHPQGEVRPADTAGDFAVPLLRLRRRGREPIPPEACRLGPRCLVCRWRREGRLEPEPDGEDS